MYYSTRPNLTTGSPSATVSYTADGLYSTDVSLAGGSTYWLAVTARNSDSLDSEPVEIGPFVADSTAPSAPVAYVDSTF